jgi:hypothetical protein
MLSQLAGAAAIGVSGAAIVAAFAPRRRLVEALSLWLLFPIPAYLLLFLVEVLKRPGDESHIPNAILGAHLLSAVLLLPWLCLCAAGFAVGLVVRRVLPTRSQRTVASPAPRLAKVDAVEAPRPSAEPRVRQPATGAPTEQTPSPYGDLCVHFFATEFAASQWAYAPRIVDLARGEVLLDLTGDDWDATVSFPAAGQVRLRLRRCRSADAWRLDADFQAKTFDLADSRGGRRTGALADVARALDDAARHDAA